ncbi:MAG: PLD nuclease N-terminal domain-containing protein [Mangrovicoccus sp.]
MVELTGLAALVLLALDIWALISILRSGLPLGHKVLWSLFVLLFPLIGFLVWLFAGPGAYKRVM